MPLPHQNFFGWLNAKYDSRNARNLRYPSNSTSRFERETFYRMKQMCQASTDENNFVMSYDVVLKLVSENYRCKLQNIVR